jgi:hypothetical protein
MSSQATALRDPGTPSSFASLAAQLRDGPLQQLLELQAQLKDITERPGDGPANRVEELERLVRLSLSAMEHFNAFTREFASVIRDLVDAQREPH